MLTAKKIADIIRTELTGSDAASMAERYEAAAEKIVTAMPDYPAMMLAGAAIENEVTSVLLDMLAATILATLIKEESGGRANITYSPESMAEMTKHFDISVEHNNMERTVRINMKPGMRDSFFGDEPVAAPSVMTLTAEEVKAAGLDGPAEPQAPEHVYDRPIWAIRYSASDEGIALAKMHDRADAERNLDNYIKEDRPAPAIQNRFCLHVDCPASGCKELASES